MTDIVLINPFVVPDAHRAEYLIKYKAVMEVLARQPGFLGGALHRAVDPGESRFQFVNVNRWASADDFKAGLAAADPLAIFGDLTGKLEANPALFTVEAAYGPSDRQAPVQDNRGPA